ncbi:hypothetical protein GN956_G26713 [Arapaima gigas]
MDGPGDNNPDLSPASHPRFCAEMKMDNPDYTRLFSRVFQNKTFHVYKLKKVKKQPHGGRRELRPQERDGRPLRPASGSGRQALRPAPRGSSRS